MKGLFAGTEASRDASGWVGTPGPVIFTRMKSRSGMTVRRVPQGSREAAEARVAEAIDDRLALVSVLSLSAWTNSGRPLPIYRRADMPIRRSTLLARHDRD